MLWTSNNTYPFWIMLGISSLSPQKSRRGTGRVPLPGQGGQHLQRHRGTFEPHRDGHSTRSELQGYQGAKHIGWCLVPQNRGMVHTKKTYPLVRTNIAIENDHWNSGFTHWKWWFSIVMLVYQRVWYQCQIPPKFVFLHQKFRNSHGL